MEIKIKYVGMDDWSREVYQNIETGRYYKRYEGELTFYTAGGFYGEPDCSLRRDIMITIVEEEGEAE